MTDHAACIDCGETDFWITPDGRVICSHCYKVAGRFIPESEWQAAAQ